MGRPERKPAEEPGSSAAPQRHPLAAAGSASAWLLRAAHDWASQPGVQQAGAAATQLLVSCSAYNATLAGFHIGAGVCRLHSATPLLGSAWGLVAVAAASAAAGHVSRALLGSLQLSEGRVLPALGRLPLQLFTRWDGREAALDAALGPLLYKLLFRHDFHRLLPSHLARPGAFGRMCVPTSASEYATAGEKAQLSVLFGRDGCHSCGSWRNGVIGDHQPPYKVVKDTAAARQAAGAVEKLLRRMADAVGLKDTALLQVYYAQCRDCSARQAQLMRNGDRATWAPGLWPPQLVAHCKERLAMRPALPGALVGLRYYVAAAVSSPPAGSAGSRKGRLLWDQADRLEEGGERPPG